MHLNDSRAWNRFYAEGTPVDIEAPTGSLVDLLDERAAQYADRPAVTFFGASLTYRELAGRVSRVANGLRELGVSAGDRVALVLPNAPQHVIAFYAVLRLGGIVVEHNPLYTRDELEAQFRDHGASHVISWDKMAPLIRSFPADLGIRTVVSVDITRAMPWTTQLALRLPVAKARASRAKLTAAAPGMVPFARLEKSAPLPAGSVPRPGVTDIACLQYTSGTTGVPKGAIITHGNLWANARQGAAWMPRFTHGDGRIYGLLPMFHAFGLLLSVIYAVETGSNAVLFPTFDPELVSQAAKKHPPTFIPAVPPMFDRLARVAREGKLDLSGVVYSISGAMTLTPAVVKRWEELAGSMLNEGYGLTETSPVALANPFDDARKIGTIGIPFPSTDIRVVDPNDPAREVELGEAGELLIKGPQVFQGYWNRPEETAQALLEGGWLRTGDLVMQDEDGFVTVVDRKKEIIITGGLNVSPSEVEKVLDAVPGIAGSAVVGVPRGGGAEVVTAVVVLEPGAVFDEDAVRAAAREHLAEYKRPTAYRVWEELPTTLIGKVLRRRVRDTLIADRHAVRAAPED
ncbi:MULTISPECIES: long-chain-fatty-acid--CoA ligase [Microbacterium]|uniref:Long-chain fatty acid--CoA ligase n=1 Tax=Microbacterium wangchenii TaxID=2541726 RepID=A0ABX5SYV1_9MICO|nr:MULTISPECIES: long-chain-fatty-acid--CoA ligase [Microbacterium]MCK6066152.1 AMP-binding protein [Microbacterium sp. EYE_512]QBR90430.1 long-chain fatty acid--CoA ligase [Microbacterium wangchenii]TFV84763.1 long-chain fatty acid--CoA ligase [Microbacterium sp. dk485]TXK14455.1 AMP-binding protein [Microbacterium wangchenii]